ncbi:hypothetical protein K9N50_11350 [bacterium]|nr:hypothetical protein [bacterium]
MEPTIEDVANDLREACKKTEKQIRRMLEHGVFEGEQTYPKQHGEMKANIMLAVRHIEDARMRLGKVCQYAGDGVSIYDKA